ncbi:hypothetical protein AKJ37_05370, partial [candidate division MSBL1 archaeon SCGC-AAA259I09]
LDSLEVVGRITDRSEISTFTREDESEGKVGSLTIGDETGTIRVAIWGDRTEDVGADMFMHYNFIPTGRGKEMAKLDLNPHEREELLKKLAKESENREINLLSTAPQYGRVCAEGGLETTSLTHFDTVGQEEGMSEKINFLAEFGHPSEIRGMIYEC